MKIKLIILSIVALCLSAAPAMAVPFNDGGAALQTALDGITTSPAGASSVNVATDEIPDNGDSLWQIGGSGASATTLIFEFASLATTNSFGLYDATNPTKLVQVFAGADAPGGIPSGSLHQVSIVADGSVYVDLTDSNVDFAGNLFGFYLSAPLQIAGAVANNIWYSDTLLNVDQMDHMAAYQGVGDTIQIPGFLPGPWAANEFVLAWEDLPLSTSDRDFTDFVVMVESVSPVPVPGAVLLGILGLSAAGIKLRRFA